MITISLENKKYIVDFQSIDYSPVSYTNLDLAQKLCKLRLGNNIIFFKIPFKDKWVVINNILKLIL